MSLLGTWVLYAIYENQFQYGKRQGGCYYQVQCCFLLLLANFVLPKVRHKSESKEPFLHIYRIERSNLETRELFGDEAHIYYVNARYNGDDELGDLMHDFLCSDPDEMRTERLKERAAYLKHNPKGVAAMCQLLEEMCEEARAEGVEQGIEQGLEQGIEQGIEQGKNRLAAELEKLGVSDEILAQAQAALEGK